MRTAVALLLLAMSNLLGCAAPLAETSYPIVTDGSMVGTWKVESPAARAVGAAPMDDPPLLMTFRKLTADANSSPQFPGAAGRPNALTWSQLVTANPGDAARYSITLNSAGNESNQHPPELTFEGQFIRTRTRTLLTMQPSAGTGWSVASFAVPIQQTVRIDREGDTMKLYRAKADLVWVPVPMAGELNFRAPAPAGGDGHTRQLAQTGDQVFAYLDGCPEDGWELMGTATKVR